jgi:hypothetical protein
VQLFVAIGLLKWGQGIGPPQRFDTPYTPTVTAICFGITAPALLTKYLLLLLPSGAAALYLAGFGADDILFLAGVAVTWYLVGRALYSHDSQQSPLRKQMTTRKVLLRLVLLFLGAVLFYLGLLSIRLRPGNNEVGAIVEGALFLLWSLSITASSVVSLTKMLQGTVQRAGLSSPDSD